MLFDVIINGDAKGDAKISAEKVPMGLAMKLCAVFSKDSRNFLPKIAGYKGKDIAVFLQLDRSEVVLEHDSVSAGSLTYKEKDAQELLSADAFNTFQNDPKAFLEDVKKTDSKDSKGMTYLSYFLGLKPQERKDFLQRAEFNRTTPWTSSSRAPLSSSDVPYFRPRC